MRNSTRLSRLTAGALFALAVALWLGSLWLGSLWVPTGGWYLQLALSGGAMASLAAGFVATLVAGRRDEKQVLRYIDALCRVERHEFSDGALLPPECANGWSDLMGRVETVVSECGSRVDEAEHARARAEVRAKRWEGERRQVAEILASLSDPVVAINHYDELLLSNSSAQDLFGIDTNLEDSDCSERVLKNLVRCEELVDVLTDTRRRKAPTLRTAEIEIAGKEGAKRWYRVNCRSIATQPNSDGNGDAPHGAVAVMTDISNEKAIQQRNAEFVSAVSHEMKTPLSGIKAYVELLADGDAEDEQTREEFLSVINGQTDRLWRLIDNLLNLARIEAGVVSVNKQQRSLNELLEEAFGIVQPSAEQKQIELVSDLSPMYLGVFADRDMMLQAAINLLSNAIKYTDTSGRVTLRSRMEGGEVVFEVEDNGVGLSSEDCERVFDKFYRVKKDQQMAAGTGLGLPLAKHIVEDVHGGKLTVRSVLGEGSTFCISLPTAGKLAEE